MYLSLLTDADAAAGGSSTWMSWVLIGLVIVAFIAMIVFSSRRNKKRQQEAEKLINAVKPGNKVKTIGGICGIVVEVDDAENTFVLETGSESTEKCYIRFDKQAIYQTDAVVEEDAKEFLARKGYDVQYGARPLKRALQTYLEDGICELVINEELHEGETLTVHAATDGKLDITHGPGEDKQ